MFNIGKQKEESGGKCLKTLLGKCLKALSNNHLPMEEIWMDFSHDQDGSIDALDVFIRGLDGPFKGWMDP